jgi:hypothetical protein
MGNSCLYKKKEVQTERNLQYETKTTNFGLITQKKVYLHKDDQKKLFRRSLHFK